MATLLKQGCHDKRGINDTTTPEIVDEIMEDWQQLGKIWDISPPTASHFGGVWERKIGQIRQVLQGFILTSDRRTLSSEELMTFLQKAARIVNSTPLWESPDNSNDAMPITPYHLITQRDDACSQNPELRPTCTPLTI